MAVWVYKDEESALINPKSLQAHIEAGWSIEEPKAEEPKATKRTTKKQPKSAEE